MAKAEPHKRNLYRDVTTRILAELDKGTVDWGSVLPNPFHIGGATMNGSVMTLARYYARQAIKRELYGQGIKLASVEASEITRSSSALLSLCKSLNCCTAFVFWGVAVGHCNKAAVLFSGEGDDLRVILDVLIARAFVVQIS
jgi:hypothetical protein